MYSREISYENHLSQFSFVVKQKAKEVHQCEIQIVFSKFIEGDRRRAVYLKKIIFCAETRGEAMHKCCD